MATTTTEEDKEKFQLAVREFVSAAHKKYLEMNAEFSALDMIEETDSKIKKEGKFSTSGEIVKVFLPEKFSTSGEILEVFLPKETSETPKEEVLSEPATPEPEIKSSKPKEKRAKKKKSRVGKKIKKEEKIKPSDIIEIKIKEEEPPEEIVQTPPKVEEQSVPKGPVSKEKQKSKEAEVVKPERTKPDQLIEEPEEISGTTSWIWKNIFEEKFFPGGTLEEGVRNCIEGAFETALEAAARAAIGSFTGIGAVTPIATGLIQAIAGCAESVVGELFYEGGVTQLAVDLLLCIPGGTYYELYEENKRNRELLIKAIKSRNDKILEDKEKEKKSLEATITLEEIKQLVNNQEVINIALGESELDFATESYFPERVEKAKERITAYKKEGILFEVGNLKILENSEGLFSLKNISWSTSFIAYCFKNSLKPELRKKIFSSIYNLDIWCLSNNRGYDAKVDINKIKKDFERRFNILNKSQRYSEEEKKVKLEEFILEIKIEFQKIFKKGFLYTRDYSAIAPYGRKIGIIIDNTVYADIVNPKTGQVSRNGEGVLQYSIRVIEGESLDDVDLVGNNVQEKYINIEKISRIYYFQPEDYVNVRLKKEKRSSKSSSNPKIEYIRAN